MADVPEMAWPALDAREAAYARVPVDGALRPREAGVVVYSLRAAARGPGLGPIRLSYLDVVIQGVAQLHGQAGVDRFFDGTAGWGPVLDDRRAPRYARAMTLRARERDAVDRGLARIGAAPAAPDDA